MTLWPTRFCCWRGSWGWAEPSASWRRPRWRWTARNSSRTWAASPPAAFARAELREAGVPILELGVRPSSRRRRWRARGGMGAYLARHAHRAGPRLRRAGGSVRGPGGALLPRAGRALQPAGLARADAGRYPPTAARDGPYGARHRGELAAPWRANWPPRTACRRRRCGWCTTASIPTRLPPRRRARGAAVVRCRRVVIGMVCALRPEKGLGLLIEAFRQGAAGVPGSAAGDRGQRSDARASCSCRGRRDCHFQPAVNERRAVAARDGYLRAALAFRSALQFADGGDGVRLLPGRVGRGRQSRNWCRDGETGLLFPFGRCRRAGGAAGAGCCAIAELRAPPGGQCGAPHAHRVHARNRGAAHGRSLSRVPGRRVY